MGTAKFIYDQPAKSADLYYVTRFDAPDPILFFEYRKKRYLVLSDLEIDRGKSQAEVDEVLSLSDFSKRAREKKSGATLADVIRLIFADFGITVVIVPKSTPCSLVDELRRKKCHIEVGEHPFYPARVIKTREERKQIEMAQRQTFAAIAMAEEILRKSRIRNSWIVYQGKRLTSERLRTLLQIFLLERGYLAGHDTIISGGKQSCDPHEVGSGPLKAHQSIIVDIFPKSMKSWYHGDATRTFCKGKAPDALNRLYATVREGQKRGLKLISAGVDGRTIHQAIHDFFEKSGYPTGKKRGRMQGFFHGTGHSIGLEVHEEPARINASSYRLMAGNVMSVEPGLYYAEIGGVRIEDLVAITSGGCKVISGYKKMLEVR